MDLSMAGFHPIASIANGCEMTRGYHGPAPRFALWPGPGTAGRTWVPPADPGPLNGSLVKSNYDQLGVCT